MVCKVKMGTYPNFTQREQWTISGDGDHGMKYNDRVESWEITGCENSSVVFYEHGDHNRHQQANVLTNGKYTKYNESKWINSHGPYASDVNGVSAAKIQSPGGESLVDGGTINATIDIPDGQGPLGGGSKHQMHDNWKNYLKPNQDHGLSDHCPGATWKAWQHAKTADKPAKALCQWKITENNMASLAASDKTHVKGKYNTIINRVCNAIKNDKPNFKTGRANKETCWDLVNTQKFMKEYCFKADDKKSNDPLCSKSSLGDSYEILASEYCDANPNDPFCGCYNVVTNKCKGEDIDKEIKRLEDARKPIEGVSSIWYGFDNKTEYLNIGQIEVYSGGKNIVKDIPGVYVTVNSEHGDGTQYKKNQMFDGNYTSMYHSAGKPNDWIKIELGKEYTIDEIKVFNRKSCGSKEANNICNDRWAGSFVKLLDSSGNLIKASEKVVGDHKEGGVRVKTFFDNGVAAAKAKLTIPGCKITVPIRRTLTDLPPSIPRAALDGADKCWGNVCGPLNEIGGDNFVPENTIVPGGICSKSMTICNVDLSAGNLQDSEINIEQKCGEQEGEPSEPSDGSTDGTPAPMGSSSTPLKSSSSKNNDDEDDEDDEKELQIYEKPAFQIGTVTSSLVSISSCALLIILAM